MDQEALVTRLGELEARVRDLELQLQEATTRERRLAVFAARGLSDASGANELELRRLQDALDHYESFCSAVQRSMGWRALQFVRGLVGRRW